MTAPLVSVIVPVRDDAPHLPGCLGAIEAQDHPHDRLEVIVVVDGATADASADVANDLLRCTDYARTLVMIDADGGTPRNLNAGLSRARGSILCRVDARSVIPPDYVRRCAEILTQRPEVAVVGGAQVAVVPRHDALGRGIARALNNRWGMGGSRYRRGARSGPADTVYLGAFRTDDLRSVGGWDTDLGTNQDFDLNRRLARRGTVWFDAGLPVEYVPRSSVAALYRQYLRFGRWKVRYWRHTGDTPRARQLALLLGVPLLAVIGGVLLALLPAPAPALLLGVGVAVAATVELAGSRRPSGGPAVHGWSFVALCAVGIGWLGGAWAELLHVGEPSVTQLRERIAVLRAGRAGRHVGQLVGGRVAEQVALGVGTLVVAARLGPGAFAPVAVLLIVNSAAVTLSDWGLGLAVLRRAPGEQVARSSYQRMHLANAAIALTGAVVGLALGGDVGTTVAASGAVWWVSSEAFVVKAVAINVGHAQRAALGEVIGGAAFLALVVGAARGSAAVAVVGAALVTKHALEIVVVRAAGSHDTFGEVGSTRDLASLWGTQAVAFGVGNVDYLLVGVLLGAQALSVYTIGYRIAVAIPSVLAYVGTRAALADLGAETEPSARQTRYLSYVVPLFVAGVVTAIASAAAGFVLALLLGADWHLVAPTVLVLACAAPWRMVFGQAGALALSVRRARSLVHWQVVQLVALTAVLLAAGIAGGLEAFVTVVALFWIVSVTAIERRAARAAGVAGWTTLRAAAVAGAVATVAGAVVTFS